MIRLLLSMAALAVLLNASGLVAQDNRALRAALDDWGDAPRSRRVAIDDDTPFDSTGIEARLGHIGFKTFGRNDSITHVEILPYVMMDANILFNDSRLFMTNEGELGGNIGVGYRFLHDGWDRVFGGSLWYDADDTTGFLFHQAGLSLETYGENWDARSNLYLPVSDTNKTYARGLIGTRFRGTGILYDQVSRIGVAMKGIDAEIGGLFPGRFSRDQQLRGYVGGYHFRGDDAPDINGVRARVEGNVTRAFQLHSELTHDGTFGTNVTLGAAFVFSGGVPKSRTDAGSNTDKLRRFTQRNYNIIVSRRVQWDYDLPAINPATGQAYRVAHVSTAGGGANNGSATDPYATIALAQAANADLIFVHSGSVLGGPIAMNPGERILGEGAFHTINLSHYGFVPVPNVTGGPHPTLLNVAGDAVTLADNSEFSGFVIDSPTGNGLVADGVRNTRVSQVDVLNAGGTGVLVQNATGSHVFRSMLVQNAGVNGLHVDGGAANVTFGGTINNNAGQALLVENTTGGHVNLTNTTISDNGGAGVRIADAAGRVTLGTTSVLNATGIGIDVQNTTGAIAFLGTTTVQNAAGTAINVDNADGNVSFATTIVDGAAGQAGVNIVNSSGQTSFARLDVDTDGGTALAVANSGVIAVRAGRLAAQNAAAADIDGTQIDVRLTSVASSNAAFGVRLNNAAGQFLVFGNGAAGTGGTIQNAAIGILVNNSGTAAFQLVNLTGNGVGAQITDAVGFELTRSSVTSSTSYGIDALNVRQLFVNNSTFTNNGGPAENTIRARATAIGSYDFRLFGNTITDATAGAVAVASSGAGDGSNLNLILNGNTITTTAAGADAVNLDWSGTINGNFQGNVIHGTGGMNDGFDINARSNASLAQLVFTGNTLDFTGGGDTGLRITTMGPSNIAVGTTLIDFFGANGTGMNFTLAQSATVNLNTNTITDHSTGATGILFSAVDGPSTFTINNNWIRLPGAGIDRGIIFGAVGDPITLQGSQNNVIENASQTFFIPLGQSTGRIFVNGVAVP